MAVQGESALTVRNVDKEMIVRAGCRLRASWPVAVLKAAHKAVRTIEPWGILIVAATLIFTISEARRERHTHEVSMRDMAEERIQEARDRDANRKSRDPEADAGQVVVLEAMVSMGMRLDRMDLSETYLRWAQLGGAEFGDSDLSCSMLANADLRGASLSGTAQGVQFLGADLRDADFEGADLSGSAFVQRSNAKSSLEGANLRNAELGRAVFWGVVLDGADFTGATLEETWFWKLDLGGARGLGPDQLAKACAREVSGLTEELSRAVGECEDERPPAWFDPLCDLEDRRRRRNEPMSEMWLPEASVEPVEVPEIVVELEETEVPVLDLPVFEIPKYLPPSGEEKAAGELEEADPPGVGESDE